MNSESNQVTLNGKMYHMKDVSLLRLKMLGTKYLNEVNIQGILNWIEDDKKVENAILFFQKFLDAVLEEKYDGPSVMDIPDAEVMGVCNLFFELASAKKISNSAG